MHRLEPKASEWSPSTGRRDDLTELLAGAFLQAPGTYDLLRDEVCRFVRAKRDAGEPPERVLIALKEIVARATVRVARTGAHAALADTVIRWCITEFYRPADSRNAT